LINVAIDAMGGDFAPAEVIKGSILALNDKDLHISLVGDEEQIKHLLKKCKDVSRLSIHHAPDVIGMHEAPTQVLKNKKNSSVSIAVKLVKEGQAQAVVSAGNTGALMTAALFGLGRVEGIERPAIATIFPNISGSQVILLDMGANVDCKPRNLLQFAMLGSLYAEGVMHLKNPRVGLLNIGEEAEKGNALTTEAYPLLAGSGLNFIGNVESKEILSGNVDVVVCDGFVGNLILKFAESLSVAVFKLFKEELLRNPISRIGALLLLPAIKRLRKRIDYDDYGGTLLLGVEGVCVKAHGRAKAKAISNAIKVAAEAVRNNIVGTMHKVSV
jgi:phosphate acyltransferase